uniref:2-methoxy-6-polyprenyl-1,4-benzoquinol methylase, mitochondrial n=1 Tax=Candidatus Methanogaster sp. ANME-2c ERB4 TaxID=2759911 RepID=A0A7G9YRS3_9EURY|nr:2-methoxy-6-polyprenyl-1,4-benzoquinol methylase, mitochondrial [Methanosarcinales archaeon ANME-2c ERB4]
MNNKIAQKNYYDSCGNFDILELGTADGRENKYRKRFISRRAEAMAKLAGLDGGSTVLEVGCGTGIYTVHWIKSTKKLYGLDISRGMLVRLREKIEKTEKIDSDDLFLIEGDSERMPFRNRRFDAVMSVNTVEHLDDVPAALREMRRVCRDGGKIVVSVPNGNFSAKYRAKLMQTIEWIATRLVRGYARPEPARSHGDDFTHQDISMDDLTGAFAEAGIRVAQNGFMGFVPHQAIPAGVARYLMWMEALERVFEMIPGLRSVGGVIIVCGVADL